MTPCSKHEEDLGRPPHHHLRSAGPLRDGPQILAQYVHGDLQVASIGDLVGYKFADLVRQ